MVQRDVPVTSPMPVRDSRCSIPSTLRTDFVVVSRLPKNHQTPLSSWPYDTTTVGEDAMRKSDESSSESKAKKLQAALKRETERLKEVLFSLFVNVYHFYILNNFCSCLSSRLKLTK